MFGKFKMEIPFEINRFSEDYLNKHTDDSKLINDSVERIIESEMTKTKR